MRRWFITGVSSGIGLAVGRAALERGDRVVGTVRRSSDIDPFEALGEHARAIIFDLDKPETSGAVAEEAISWLGGIDVVVCNAARSLFGAIEETSVAELESVFRTNLFGHHAILLAFLPHLRERRSGRIIAISSGAGIAATPGVGVYSASKFALEGLFEALAIEVEPFGIGVSLIEPGAVASRFISHGTHDVAAKIDAYVNLSGAGKQGLEVYYADAAAPSSVAEAVLETVDASQPAMRVPVGQGTVAQILARADMLHALAQRHGT